MTERLGWLGTGRMGTAMAGRLLDAGRNLTVWNRTAAKTAPLAAKGAEVAASIADLAPLDIVFVMVSGDADLEHVVSGEGGLLSGEETPKAVVDCSTVSPAASQRVRAALQARGVAFVAAPVSGNPQVVAAGNCTIVASGPTDAYELARPHLAAIAKAVVHAGQEDQSRLVKLCHNLYLGMLVQALAEVTTLAEKGGTDRAAFLEFLGSTVVASDWLRARTPALSARDWTPTFTNELLRKDFDLGLAEGRGLEVPLPVASMVHQRIQAAIGCGWRDTDLLSLYEQQARDAALEHPEP
ncbi:NAD(P)-dependent oxidoreductase [Streptomyces sp. NPDC056716]|uniref:NAD(P)-dependent oxidoreductase n=1 Tax=unclassified Streptomyces TaxID=2593676 RepID=UPI00368BF0BB